MKRSTTSLSPTGFWRGMLCEALRTTTRSDRLTAVRDGSAPYLRARRACRPRRELPERDDLVAPRAERGEHAPQDLCGAPAARPAVVQDDDRPRPRVRQDVALGEPRPPERGVERVDRAQRAAVAGALHLAHHPAGVPARARARPARRGRRRRQPPPEGGVGGA